MNTRENRARARGVSGSWWFPRLALLGLILTSCTPAPQPPPPPGDLPPEAPPQSNETLSSSDLDSVHRVVDGDTVDLVVDGALQRVRLKGINTPEKGECMASEATSALSELVAGGVRLTVTGHGDRGRLLGYLTDASGRLIQEELVERGLALAYPYGDRDEFTDRLAQAQARAEKAGRGQFAAEACGPAQVAKGLVRIVAMDANPSGDDLQLGGGESVTIEGPAGLSLAGWTLKDTSASHRLRFGDDVILGVDGRLVVFSACGTPERGRLYWCRKGSAIWNNSGDTAFLQDPHGNLMSTMNWSP